MSRKKLLVTDINGTIHAGKSGIPEEVLTGFERLREKGIITTITTGRSVTRANDLLGTYRDKIITIGSPLSLENGGRLLSSDMQNLRYYPIPPDILIASVALAREVDTKYVAYSPEDPSLPIRLWLSNGQNPDRFIKENGNHVNIVNGDLANFAEQMDGSDPCMIRIGTNETDAFEKIADASVFLNLGEVNILAAGVSKALGVINLAEYFGIDLENVLVAGNDSNDIPMLELPVGFSAFVETETGGYQLPDNVVHFPSIQSFGNFLSKVA